MQCSIVEKSPWEGSKMGGYALDLNKTKFTALMRNHSFSTLCVAIYQQCCIDNQYIHNTNDHMCLSCVRDDMLNFLQSAKLKTGQ